MEYFDSLPFHGLAWSSLRLFAISCRCISHQNAVLNDKHCWQANAIQISAMNGLVILLKSLSVSYIKSGLCKSCMVTRC